MDNPTRGNALTPGMMLDLASALRESSDDSLRVAILRGSGDRIFCSGYDLSALQLVGAPGDDPPEDWSQRFPELTELLRALEEFPVPLIAAVNGHAIGGGALLASFCDFRIARSGATFRIPATRLGVLYPLEGIRRLVALIGGARGSSCLLTASAISTSQGLDWGLYEDVVDGEALDDRVEELADLLCGRAPLSVRGLRAILRALAQDETESALRSLHHSWTSRCLGSEDLAEGITAVVDRRDPQFRGC